MSASKGRRLRLIAGVFAIAIAMLSQSAIAEHVPLVDVSLGFAYQSNFNADNGGFTAFKPVVPPVPAANSTWAHGAPTSGPGFAFSGTKVWATNLAGNYANSECSALLSPPINLTAATTASASFMQWRHMEQSTTAFDGGLLFVTTDGLNLSLVTPAGGYTSSVLGITARTCLHGQPSGAKGLSGPTGAIPPPAVYSAVSTDLTAFAGQTVQFVIAFASDSSVSRAGWYVDDFAVTINGSTTTETFESGNGGFTVINPTVPKLPKGWSHGTHTTGPALAPASDPPLWATNLTGDYGFNECSSITSPDINLWPLGMDLMELDDGLPAMRAIASWKQWFRSSSFSAGGVLQVLEGEAVTNLKPTTGYPGTPTATGLDACLKHQTQGTGAFTGAINALGTPLTDYTADLTPWVGKTIKLRYLFASTATATLDKGWYVDDLNVELRATVGEPHAPAPPSAVPFTGASLYTQGFETDNGGYTTGGITTFEYGTVVSPPTPLDGQGTKMWGTNIDGPYNNSECGYLQSAPIDLSAVPADTVPAEAGMVARLAFRNWREIEAGYDGAVVALSSDGITWTVATPLGGYDRTLIISSVRTCLGLGLTDKAFSGPSSQPNAQAWETEEFDVTSFLGGALHVRWLFATDSSVIKRGWYIDDVSVDVGAGGIALPAPPPPPAAV